MSDHRALMEKYEVSLAEIQKARRVADKRFGGDIHLGILWVHADAFAINVKGDREARERWNDRWARNADIRSPQA